jgi:hypothetical protein
MAIKYFCDGCDALLDGKNEITVRILNETRELSAPGPFNLCSLCQKHLIHRSIPTNWPREKSNAP